MGDLWSRDDGGNFTVGLLTEEKHCNHYPDTVHGGVLMTFADNALGFGVVRELGGTGCFTASLQTQFASSARIGDFLTCRPEIVRKTRSLVFVRGLLKVDDRVIASADGIWKVMEPL